MNNKKSPKPLLGKIATYESTAEARAPLAEFFSSKEFFEGEATRKASFFGRKGCDLLCSPEDFASQCSFSALEHPEKNASEIVALVVTQALQGRSRSAIASVRLDREVREGESEVQIEAKETEEIEEWRKATDDEIETLRHRIRATRNVTDRCARQIFQRTTGKVERADTDDLFGRDSYRQVIRGGGEA